MKFHLATTNQGKISEFGDLMKAAGHELVIIDPIECPEPYDSFERNALKKARAYANEAGGLAFADDSGLVVDALDGEPGVRSARYAQLKGRIENEEDLTDEELDRLNNEVLLDKMEGVENRSAKFVISIVVANEDGEKVYETTGECYGRITSEPRGDDGFGYDPVFEEPETGLTFAELDKARKNLISHRRKAMRTFKEWLASLKG